MQINGYGHFESQKTCTGKTKLKGLIHPKNLTLSLITLPHVVPNP